MWTLIFEWWRVATFGIQNGLEANIPNFTEVDSNPKVQLSHPKFFGNNHIDRNNKVHVEHSFPSI